MAKRTPKPRAPREVEVPKLDVDSFLRFPPPLLPGQIFGQERAFKLINDTLRSGRVHHAWIFHGPEGVGKFTSAITFASLLLDPTTQPTFGGDFEPDQGSTTQRLLRSGSHPDLHIVVKELAQYHPDKKVRDLKQTSIGIDVIREFLVKPAGISASVKTASLASKVFIINDAHLMKPPAQTAVLKVLEEPPPRVVVILVTSSEETLLPTIRSRSQRVYLPPLSHQHMHGWLTSARESLASLRLPPQPESGDEPESLTLADGHPPAISPEEENFLTQFAAGSPGSFSQAYERGIYLWWKQIGPLLVAAEKGQFQLDLGPLLTKLIDEMADHLVEQGENASKENAKQDAADWMFKLIGNYLHRRMKETARAPQASRPIAAYAEMLDRLHDAQSELASNVTTAFVMDKLAAELSAVEL